jgi:Zn-dependent metalloprotease
MGMKPASLSAAILAVLMVPVAAMAATPDLAAAGARAKALLSGAAATRLAARTDADTFTARAVSVDADGTEHVHLDRSYRGLSVIGGDVVVESKAGALKRVSQTLRSSLRPTLAARIKPDAAAVEAGVRFGGKVAAIHHQELVVYARGAMPRLAYEIDLAGEPSAGHSGWMRYYVDAATRKVLDVQDLVQTVAAVGTGKSYYYGNLALPTDKKSATKYDMIDTTRGNGSVYDLKGAAVSNVLDILIATLGATLFTDADNVWGNNATSDRATVATDIHYGVGVTWDYYKNVHGRLGLANDGKGIKSYAHSNFKTSSGGTSGVNAAYVALVKSMFYGDGDPANGYGPVVGIDVAGHEMTHGVTAATSNLAYSGDAGGLNESSSDILGTMVEFYANNPNDAPDYRIGEKMRTDGKAFRDMYNQAADGHSFNCYIAGGFDPNNDTTHNPHYTSGVGNRFFYLLAEGAVVPAGSGLTPSQLVCNGDTGIAGIGRDKAGKIWYRALTTKFTSSTTYPQARAATIASADELYGAGSAESAAVARAWSAASVN